MIFKNMAKNAATWPAVIDHSRCEGVHSLLTPFRS